MESAFRMPVELKRMINPLLWQFGRVYRRLGVSVTILLILGLFARSVPGQNYQTSTGTPSFGTPEPVELGEVDASNGNLHLSIPLGSYTQRGTSQPESISLQYDSNIWAAAGSGTSAEWYPNNGPAYFSQGGWSVSYLMNQLETPFNQVQNCTTDIPWMDQNGTVHYFHINTANNSECQQLASAYATDSSGYQMYVTNNYPTFSEKIYAPDGTLAFAYPGTEDSHGNWIGTEDTNGNYFSTSGYTLTDTLGRQIATYGGSGLNNTVTVSTSQRTAQYQLAFVTINVKTNFQQPQVSEQNTTINVLRTLTLPDAAQSTYTFTYDCDESSGNSACSSPAGQDAYYGEVTGITLPTGGTVSYSYNTFSDAYGNKNRWVNSRSSADGSWYYSLSVLKSCSSNQYFPANGCEQVTSVLSPTGQTIYTFQLNNGAWPSTIIHQDLQGNVQSTVTNTWDFSQPCVLINCNGASFVRLLSQQTTVPSAGSNLTKQTKYTYDTPWQGNRTAIEEWGYTSSGTFASVPDRATYMSYLYAGENIINKPLSVTLCNNLGTDPTNCPGGGSRVSQTLYTYDCYSGGGCTALTSVTGVAQHDDANFGAGYTTRGNPTSISKWVSGSSFLTTSYAYDTTGQVLKVTDPANNQTVYSYADNFFTDNFFTDNGNDTTLASYAPSQPTNAYPTSVTDPIGTQKEGYYFGSGSEAVAIDYNSQSTYSHYQDGLNRQTEEIYPTGWSLATYSSATQSDLYSPVAAASPSTACSSCKHSMTILDSWGRTAAQILVNNPTGPVEVDSVYDTGGRLSSQSHPYSGSGDPNHVFETIGYDALDRQISTKHPDGQSQQAAFGPNVATLGGLTSQQGATSTYGYGYPQISEDESGHLRQQWLDGFGRIIEVDEPGTSGSLTSSPFVTNYIYDVAGRLTQVIQGIQTRAFAYDGLGRKISETTPEGGNVTYYYTVTGGGLCSGDPSSVCQRIDARGVVSNYSYDHGGRLLGVAYTVPSGKNIAAMPNVCTMTGGTSANICYTYDQGGATAFAIGRLTAMSDATGSESYSHDASGRVTQLSKVISGQTYTISYQYDVAGDVMQITYPSGRVVQQAYNQVGQLCQIAPSAANCSASSGYYAAGFSYNAPGKLLGFNYGNGVTGTFYYSPDRTQLTYLAYTKGNSTLFNLQYSYEQSSPYSPPCPLGTTMNNGSVQCITDNVDKGRSVGYSYDPLSRMSSAKTCGSSAFSQWGLAESYDRFGNRWSQTLTAGSGPSSSLAFGTNGPNGSTTNQPNGYTYDSSGNMTVEPLTASSNMTYDGENRMTAFSGNGGGASYTYDGNGLRVAKSVQGGTVTVSIYSGSSVIAEYDNGAVPSSPSREYIAGPSGLLAMFSGGATTYYHQDHLSVRLTTDANGNVLTQEGTFPFGESWYQSGSANKWFFTSYQQDSESGLNYALARYYDSRTGTFLMVDPIAGSSGDPQSWNRYAYARNNPIMITDPSGQHWWDWLITAGAIAADIYTAGAATALENIGEGLAVGVASNAVETGHLGINEKDLEGAAIGGALSAAEAKIPMKWANFYEKSGVDFAERSFNSLVENAAITGHARVDWIDAGIGAGLDMLNDYANARSCSARSAKAANAAKAVNSSLNGNNSVAGGHADYGTNATTSQLTTAGYPPFSIFGISNGNRNGSLFMQPHFHNGEVHFDTFNARWGYGVGAVLHGGWDLGIGSIFFGHSTMLDPGC